MKPVDEESNTTPAGMSQTKRIICLVIFLIVCAALSWGAINLPSFTHSKEEPLSDVKAWGIGQVDKRPTFRVSISKKSLSESTKLTRTERFEGSYTKLKRIMTKSGCLLPPIAWSRTTVKTVEISR